MNATSRKRPTHAPYGSVEVVLPILGYDLETLGQAIRSIKRQNYAVHRIILVGQHPEDNLVSAGLHFSSQQIATVRLSPQMRLFSGSWWAALMPHLTADWVGVQLPFARSHAHRFTEQICYLTKHPNTVLCLAHTWLADQDCILSPGRFNPHKTSWEHTPRVALFWSTHCFAQTTLLDPNFIALCDEVCRGKTRKTTLATYVMKEALLTLCLSANNLDQFGPHARPVSPFQTTLGDLKIPSIGVCIPAKNVAKYLPAALKSLGRQSYCPDEVMFIDDNSTDDTDALARSSGVVTSCIKGPNRWASGARNKGIQMMQSEILSYSTQMTS